MIGQKLAVSKKKEKFWPAVPPWIILGIFAVLFPIFGYMAFENINRQKHQSTRLLLEKGAALIRSFEAGTRTGIMGMKNLVGFELQRLLAETAQQPDIIYIIVADVNGTILAHSNTDFIGKPLPKNLDMEAIARQKKVLFRIIETDKGKNIFEVFRQFAPTSESKVMQRMYMMFNVSKKEAAVEAQQQLNYSPPELCIFVGLDMTSVEEARWTDALHTAIMACILLFIGLSGIVVLFLAHGYRAAQTSLSRIKAFSDTLVENIPIGLLAIDTRNRIASLNPIAKSVLGYSFDWIGKEAKIVLPETLWKQVERLEKNQELLEKEIECDVGKDKFIPLEICGSPLKDEGGDISGYVLLFKDLTEIRSLRKEIIRGQRLASVGRLAAGVAHEIRNPLSSIKGFATYFSERYKDSEEDNETASVMIQEVNRLNRVVGQLLELSRPIIIKRKPEPVNDLIKNSLVLVQRQADDNRITIEKHLPEISPIACLDADKISQVLLNLYLNGIEAMKTNSHGGTLSVFLSELVKKDKIEIRISDTGYGIKNETLSHIFDPFFTTRPSGTGLGLAIVHNIMEAHNGDIKVESKFGEGTTIILRLPPEDSK